MPNSFVITPDNVLLVASGFDRVLRWDGFRPQAEPAGVPAPAQSPVVLSGSGAGPIIGTYTAYCRFVDAAGNLSNSTPVSAQYVAKGTSGKISAATNALPVTIQSANHGLHSNDRVSIAGVLGNTAANGKWTIIVIDKDHFSLPNVAGNGTYVAGSGTWTAGVHKIVYSKLPVPASPRVARRQILRNTDGQAVTYYVDIDTGDLSSTTLSSTRSDAQLLTQLAVAVLDKGGQDLLNLYGVPPDDRCHLAYHLGRVFAAGTVEYAEGNIDVKFGRTTVEGVGTEWTEVVPGRFLFVAGGDQVYQIASVDVTNQVLTLNKAYSGPTDPYAPYSIRPGNERLVYWTEPGLSEAWPAVNAFALPPDGDEVTGLLTKGSFLFILERRHVYRFTYEKDPALDGFAFLAARRGCVNQNCVVLVEDTAYMLDEDGVHEFDARRQTNKSDGATITDPVQTLFRATGFKRLINWSASRYFHGVHDPAREVVKWFVALSGQYLPRHALCYAYQLDRWWLEEYPCPVGSSALGKLARSASSATWGVGRDQVFLGADARRVLAAGAGPLDGVDPDAAPWEGAVVASGRDTVTLDAVPDAGLVGNPIVISGGRGSGQLRTVCQVVGNVVRVSRPWSARPDATSRWAAGGVPWQWLSGWFSWAEEESSNERRVEVFYEPTRGPAGLVLRRYSNRREEPEAMRISTARDGVLTTEGDPDVRVSLEGDGHSQVRIEGSRELYTHGDELVSIGLSGVAGKQPVRVFQVNLDGAEANNQKGGQS